MNSPWASSLLGAVLGDYNLVGNLGEGQFGIVFEGRQVHTGARVAVKVLDPQVSHDARISAEFDNEGLLLTKLNSCSHIVNLVDSGNENVPVALGNGASAQIGVKYHVLSLASGGLAELTSKSRILSAMPWEERLRHWRGVIKGVHQMHIKSVAHRDLKADNVLLMAGKGSSIEVRIADLGKSKNLRMSAGVGPSGYVMGRGDLGHAPPECLCLQAGSEPLHFKLIDLYGLGSILTELISGQSMTSIAIVDWQALLQASQMNLRSGTRQDLAALRPNFDRAVHDVVDMVPRVMRYDTQLLLTQLCSPVPLERLPQYLGKRLQGRDGLNWLLRRVDILQKRLDIDLKTSPRRAAVQKRGA